MKCPCCGSKITTEEQLQRALVCVYLRGAYAGMKESREEHGLCPEHDAIAVQLVYGPARGETTQ